ncbi:hypothetical protein Q9R08_12710 [Microbacterium sp. QXD-8]|uniref:Uncharacterized protein n=1 Tax=Microbacterium psychrotolerans TaxID=3068321 RepID=A0ABU0Z2P1_9MICO|nr:hypothetical protein [Microbacterium sp. QXD-8]MDQ7878844.1 hypothetical protein [Microbacterium sp. QXD-8]
MSSAEPFMPAHEPSPSAPPEEHDIDHDADVLFDSADASEDTLADAQPWHTNAAAAPLPRPVAGAQLTREQLSADLASDGGE